MTTYHQAAANTIADKINGPKATARLPSNFMKPGA
jgi:hypothetical protein